MQENVSLGPQVRDGQPQLWTNAQAEKIANNDTIGELVFGVARIFASFNDTFVHVTDLRFVRPFDIPPLIPLPIPGRSFLCPPILGHVPED